METVEDKRIKRLATQVREGSQIALGRALTLAETGSADGRALLDELRPHTGKARILGFTGPPGAGKSTLVDALIHEFRKAGTPVAVLAVDPVSPLSGGAVLGDRTRMGAHSLDDGVFIRSVSARGHLGGLCLAAHDMADVMDAAGWPVILVETVGAGQSETEIAQLADLSVVVSAPGLGDELQAIKAGILEIADVLVVNKADKDEAGQTAKALEGMLALRSSDRQSVPVLQTSATTGQGVSDLKSALEAKLTSLGESNREKRRIHRQDTRLQKLVAQLLGRLTPDQLDKLQDSDLAALVEASIKGHSSDQEA